MNGTIRARIGITSAAAMLVLVGAGTAQTAQRPHGVTVQQWRAQLVRGDALNKRYHLGKYSPAAQAGPRPAGVTKQQWQAELIRGDALNRRYGLGVNSGGGGASASTRVAPGVVTVAPGGFDWGAAGIGAGAAIGLGLFASGMVVVLRQVRRSQLTTTA